MDSELKKRINEINTENVVFLIFIILIIMSYVANSFEKKYFLYSDNSYKKIYYYIQVVIFFVVVSVNLYYVYISYLEVANLSRCSSYKKIKYAYLDYYASIFALLAGLILLYVAVDDVDIDTEISL